MIIYMYLAIIVVFSIITGIITTIIDKRKKKTIRQTNVVNYVNFPSKVLSNNRLASNRKKYKTFEIPVIEEDYIKLLEATSVLDLTRKIDQVEIGDVSSISTVEEPILLSVIDEDVL